MSKPCERLWEVDALREGRLSRLDIEAHRRHAATCHECRDRFAADERLANLGRALAAPEPDPLRVRRLRRAILRGSAEPPPAAAGRRLAPFVVAAAVAVAAAGVWGSRLGASRIASSAPPIAASADAGVTLASTVTASDDARWSRSRVDTTERIRLEAGTISLRVRKLSAAERFFVDLPDGEVEVRGTAFGITVLNGATTSIRVDEGLVAFRHTGAPELVLGAGESWTARSPDPAVTSALPVRPAPAVPGAPRRYQRAVEAYDVGDYADAAEKLAAFVSSHPSAPEVEDAMFLEASALARSGRANEASASAERFLTRYPGSFHARDAAVLAARGARDRGDCGRARRLLEPWRSAPTADVASLLRACPDRDDQP